MTRLTPTKGHKRIDISLIAICTICTVCQSTLSRMSLIGEVLEQRVQAIYVTPCHR